LAAHPTRLENPSRCVGQKRDENSNLRHKASRTIFPVCCWVVRRLRGVGRCWWCRGEPIRLHCEGACLHSDDLNLAGVNPNDLNPDGQHWDAPNRNRRGRSSVVANWDG
jgi:hypothetical protein